MNAKFLLVLFHTSANARKFLAHIAQEGFFVAYEPWPDDQGAVYLKAEHASRIGEMVDASLELEEGKWLMQWRISATS